MDDTPNKMLEDVVRSLGGSKAVAPKLWPEKSVLDAQKTLCDCLNDDRSAKLDFAQVLLILRMARDADIHIGMEYIAQRLSYAPPEPIEPADELAELLRENLQDLREAAKRQARIEALLANHQNPTRLRSA